MSRIARFVTVAAGLAAANWSGPARADAGAGIAAFQATDYATALHELAPAAKDGDPEAAYTLAHMYAAGLGVAKDPVRAVELFRAAAEKGHGDAQNNLGAALFLGEGVEQDMAEGLKWIVIAGDNGLLAAQQYLAKVAPYVTKTFMLEARKRAREWQAGGQDRQTGETGDAEATSGQ